VPSAVSSTWRIFSPIGKIRENGLGLYGNNPRRAMMKTRTS
jgi:hypothetical protein